jgi:L-methionine (R)-S-oxide reductase
LEQLLGRIDTMLRRNESRADILFDLCTILHNNVPGYDWVGIYFADSSKKELILGPFRGEPTDHIRIPFGRGICGLAAERGTTVVVGDVSGETNYLACSLEVKSEIVVPVTKSGRFVAEIDIDSHRLNTFDESDREFLEKIAEMISGLF